ncbi:TadG family pilus assembly protein [uncultured Agrobacterium sp.]|uniref:TadG family pilus assembly protein n=1 Tax=uncultured Agrobacterium sp. TaxID=157277 RepID=UPI0025F0495A|nr:TadG family pilus assembly protein [uncultured Agrobacterium sp.]
MHDKRPSNFQIWKNKSGNIAITAGLTAPLFVGILALGVDYGALTLQKRELQQTADLAAISAAAAVNPDQAVLQYFKLNGKKIGIKTENGLLTDTGFVSADIEGELAGVDGYATVTKGRYVPDSTVDVGQRFVADASPTNAVKVEIVEKGQIYFASSFTTAPKISAVGTAAASRVAAFSVGSRLLSLNEGLLNAVLSGLLGSSVNLKLMDYQALVSADINLLKTIDILAIDLGLQAGTYRDLLTKDITLSQFLNALGRTGGLQPSLVATIKSLERAANKTSISLPLEKIVNLGPFLGNMVGSSENLKVTAKLFDLVSAAAIAANGNQQIAINAGASVPGLAATKLTIAIGEPPVSAPPLAVGSTGTVVRTAQTRLAIETSVTGLKALLGLQINLPLYVEVANAEAKLADIRCMTPGDGAVDIDVVPGLAEIALGNVDTSAFNNFGRTPRVTKASILDSAVVRINGMAQINSGNLTKSRLTFYQADIQQARIKQVSTKDVTTSLVASLLKKLDVDINVLFLTIGSPAIIQSALADTLSAATKPIDELLYNTLLVMGVKIGEADVRVTDLRCMQPVLVQ